MHPQLKISASEALVLPTSALLVGNADSVSDDASRTHVSCQCHSSQGRGHYYPYLHESFAVCISQLVLPVQSSLPRLDTIFPHSEKSGFTWAQARLTNPPFAREAHARSPPGPLQTNRKPVPRQDLPNGVPPI
ncbi:hypothetical protein EDB19DRAFT_1660671, partial [Suillus lakei]